MDDGDWNLMVIPLKFTWQPTVDEIAYLRKVVCRRMEQRERQSITEQDFLRPSVIIDDFLYHGDLKHASNKALLDELDIRCIINVSDFRLDENIVNQRHVLWINVEDQTYTDIAEHFKLANEFLQSCKARGDKVLVHCQMGVSRSTTIVLAYLIKYYHDSLGKAYDYLIERRRCAEPNLGFLLQLIRYERELHNKDEMTQEQHTDKPPQMRTIQSESMKYEETIPFQRPSSSLCCWPLRITRLPLLSSNLHLRRKQHRDERTIH